MRKLWKDRIGEVLNVEGIMFTIVEVEEKGSHLLIEDNLTGELHETTRSTWSKGKLVKIINKIKPAFMKMVGETKRINNILFTVIEAAKEYVRIKAEGYEGEEIISVRRWKNAKFVTKKFMSNSFTRIANKCMELMITAYRKIKEENVFYNDLQEELQTIRTAYSLDILKKAYRAISKKTHPDMGNGNGDVATFDLATHDYKIRKQAINVALEEQAVGLIDSEEEFMEAVDLNEGVIREMNALYGR